MPRIIDLANEVLQIIISYVGPNDLDSFLTSCRSIRQAAGNQVFEHQMNKLNLTIVENGPCAGTRWEYPALLDLFLQAPRMADYVKAMVIRPWKVCWDVEDRTYSMVAANTHHRPYLDHSMRALEEIVKGNTSITALEKEHWLSNIKAGDENPVIAMLLPQLHYLTSLVMILDGRNDFFMLKTLENIAKDPRSPSLSRLRKVEVRGQCTHTHRVDLLLALAALPSIVSLKGYQLVQGPNDSTEATFEMAPHSSSLRDLEIDDCHFLPDTLFTFIRSVKSMRSFTYTRSWQATHPSFTKVRAALRPFASTSLEELTLHRTLFDPTRGEEECVFKHYCKLRRLTINYGLLMGDNYHETNKIVQLLPASLEVFTLDGCGLKDIKWILGLRDCVIEAKRMLLPRLEELNLVKTLCLEFYRPSYIAEVCASTEKAGFKMTATSDGVRPWY